MGSDAVMSVGTLLEPASHRVHRVGKEVLLVAIACPPEVRPLLYAGLRGQGSDLALSGVMKLVRNSGARGRNAGDKTQESTKTVPRRTFCGSVAV